MLLANSSLEDLLLVRAMLNEVYVNRIFAECNILELVSQQVVGESY